MGNDDIQERVLKVIATTKRLPRESVSPDSSFESLGIDSLDRLNILFDLESEFDIQINDEEAKQVENIPQMVAGVRHLVEAREHQGATGGASVVSTAAPGPAATRSSTTPTDAGGSQTNDTEPVKRHDPASSAF